MGDKIETADKFYDNKNPDNKRSKLLKEFQEYIEQETPIDFFIENGEIEVDNIGGFSDGIYKLENHAINTIDSENNLYLFKGDFKLKRKGFIYKKDIEFSFHYSNGNKLVIKYRGKFYEYYINNKSYIIKTPIHGYKKNNRHTYRRNRGGKIIREEGAAKIIMIGNIKLRIKFKTD